MAAGDTRRQALLLFTPEWNGMHPGAWRLPESPADGAMDLATVVGLVQAAERAKFHAFFLADALGFRLEISPEALARTGAGTRLEPFTLIAALAMRTERIGLVLTANTTYDEPYHVARRLASLDHISGGRAGWNIVTGGFPTGAKHFGRDEHVPHAERYARGIEFVDAVQALWDSYEDDAFELDKESGRAFDPAKLHTAAIRGEHVAVTGPLNVARPPQGHPVIAQAGSSATGRDFAARFGELIFTIQPTPERAREFREEIRAAAAAHGRDPDGLRVLPSLTLVLGETEAEAAERAARLDELADPRVGIELLSAFLETDLTGLPRDGPLPEIGTAVGTTSVQRFFVEKAEREGLTIGGLIPAALGFGSIAGTPTQIADRIEAWLDAGAADGFNVTFADMPTSMDLFTGRVIPELQRRGLFHREYEGATLRESLGLSRPRNRFADT
ncbi:MAG: LLM class flavin-dependent oxidoreductase [Actinobacteria bacterium]|nr:LLM class flavin-dependent oxidoreductase [Actinomycetota bacterium]